MSGKVEHLRKYVMRVYGLSMTKREAQSIINICMGDPEPGNDVDMDKLSKFESYRKPTINETLEFIYGSRLSVYDKARAVIYFCKIFGGRYHVTIIHEDIWQMFFLMSEDPKYGIVLDKSKSYQYFYVRTTYR